MKQLKAFCATIIFIGISLIINAQVSKLSVNKNATGDSSTQAKDVIRTADNLKSGNWNDVLTNFFQLGFRDLTGDHRSFNFKSTLFALKLKTDSSLLVDTNYVRHTFDRNFQFNFGLNLDQNYKFNGFSTGATWAIINKRDSTLISFIGKPEDKWFDEASKDLASQFNAFDAFLRNDTDGLSDADKKLEASTKMAFNEMAKTNKYDIKLLPERARSFFSKATADNYNKVIESYNKALEETRTKPLLTFGFNGIFKNQSHFFDSARAELIYLQGLKKEGKNIEVDIRTHFEAKDTTINNKRYRTKFGVSGGFNFTLIANKENKQQSILEFKSYIEYNSITGELLPGENRSTFLANADLRLRIFDGFWIPVTIKYDLRKSNFLGFLNVAFNWDAFKKASKH